MSILVPLDRITDSPYQTREHYDPERIAELAESIERDGLIQAPVARLVDRLGEPLPDDAVFLGSQADVLRATAEGARVELAVGHSRLRAFRHLGRDAMPVELRPLTDRQMDMLAWAENHQRQDLDPIEEARAIEARIGRYGWTQEQAAGALGLGRSTVANKLRLLTLPEDWRAALAAGEVTARQALAAQPGLAFSAEEIAELEDGYYTHPGHLLDDAKGGHGSDILRQKIDGMRRYLDELQRATDHEEHLQEVDREARYRDVYDRHYKVLVSSGSAAGALERAWEEVTRTAAEADAAGSSRHAELQSLASRIRSRLDALHDDVAAANAASGAGGAERERVISYGFAEEEELRRMNAERAAETKPLNTDVEPRGAGAGPLPEIAGGAATEEREHPGTGEPMTPAWPQPVYDPVWDELDRMTKAELEEVVDRFDDPHRNHYGHPFTRSGDKRHHRTLAEECVRYQACAEVAYTLADEQVDEVYGWVRAQLGIWKSGPERVPLPWAVDVLCRDVDNVQRRGHLSASAFRTYRRGEARRMIAFCYHLVLESVEHDAQREADMSLDDVHPEELQVY